ncbi:response regulator [Flavobacterium sp. XGLA_31]|uniref:response regulator n=1 Tax=Flavobacterium sp. XGLA_31 TaxID=3447666 RepID=UPI003F2A9FC3
METAKTIYYLDDDFDDLGFFKEIVEELGHTVKIFSDGRKLLSALASQEDYPDIIFLDVHMPVLNGEEILEIIMKSDDLKHLSVVMVSGAHPYKKNHYAHKGIKFLIKKHHYKEFKEAIVELLAFYTKVSYFANGFSSKRI